MKHLALLLAAGLVVSLAALGHATSSEEPSPPAKNPVVFWELACHDAEKSAVVTFRIPGVGISFKAPFGAVDADHSDLASLLALLEFIDSNQKYFSNHTYSIFGNNLRVINFVNRREAPPERFAHLLKKAEEYRKKYRFSLQWVPTSDNPVFDTLFD